MIQIAKALGKAPKYTLNIKDVISDFNGKPHRMIKMIIKGDNFPIRNAAVFVRIRNGRIIQNSWLIELSANADSITSCFPIDMSYSGDVEFGYADEIFGVFKNPKWKALKKLEPKLMDKDVVEINKKWIEKAMAKKK